VVGGAKLADKIALLPGIIGKAEKVLIGGFMAFTFLAAQGVGVGSTYVERAWLDHAKSMLETAKQKVRRPLSEDLARKAFRLYF
jgi:phosphoglycerate kinase